MAANMLLLLLYARCYLGKITKDIPNHLLVFISKTIWSYNWMGNDLSIIFNAFLSLHLISIESLRQDKLKLSCYSCIQSNKICKVGHFGMLRSEWDYSAVNVQQYGTLKKIIYNNNCHYCRNVLLMVKMLDKKLQSVRLEMA